MGNAGGSLRFGGAEEEEEEEEEGGESFAQSRSEEEFCRSRVNVREVVEEAAGVSLSGCDIERQMVSSDENGSQIVDCMLITDFALRRIRQWLFELKFFPIPNKGSWFVIMFGQKRSVWY